MTWKAFLNGLKAFKTGQKWEFPQNVLSFQIFMSGSLKSSQSATQGTSICDSKLFVEFVCIYGNFDSLNFNCMDLSRYIFRIIDLFDTEWMID